jgi:hypothetical protein
MKKRFAFSRFCAGVEPAGRGALALCLVLCLLALTVCASADDGDQHHRIIKFDAPGAGTGASQGTYSLAINPRGVIAGFYYLANGFSRGFLRAPDGSFTEFNAPGARGAGADSINPEGAVTGPYRELSDLVWHGYLRAPDGTFTEFEVPEAGTGGSQGTFAYNINPAGAIAGYYLDANNVYHSYLRAPDGTITTFDAPGAATGSFQGTYTCTVDCLNPQGAIAGSYIDGSNVYHGYVRAPDGTITEFDVSGAGTGSGQGTTPANINPAGDIAGSYIDASNVSHGFLRTKHSDITVFDVPGAGTGSGQGTYPSCNNPADAITGYYIDASGVYHGFLRTP